MLIAGIIHKVPSSLKTFSTSCFFLLQLQLYRALASTFNELGFHRKSAFYTRQLTILVSRGAQVWARTFLSSSPRLIACSMFRCGFCVVESMIRCLCKRSLSGCRKEIRSRIKWARTARTLQKIHWQAAHALLLTCLPAYNIYNLDAFIAGLHRPAFTVCGSVCLPSRNDT